MADVGRKVDTGSPTRPPPQPQLLSTARPAPTRQNRINKGASVTVDGPERKNKSLWPGY